MALHSRGWPARVAVLAAVLLAGCRSEGAILPALGADIDATSVSGLSSGAYMAGQFQIAHSRIVIGAGIIAGGPYGCAESVFSDVMPGPGGAFLNLSKAMNGCMLDAMRAWGVPSVPKLADRTRQLARDNRIDPLEALLQDRVYLFAGAKDRTVAPAIVGTAAELYSGLGIPSSHIKLVADIPAGHAFVTESKGIPCGETADPYITHCEYDQAGELLGHIYGTLKPRMGEPASDFTVFDQREFVRDLGDHGLADAGVVYVPRTCRGSAGCRVHIVFHGCAQNRAKIGDAFVKDTGFARWADANRLIVLFPQARPSTVNPQACWDWWGYTGRDYLTRKGPQIVAVRRMLDRLASRPAANPT
jgi:hypothetical protein